MNTSGSRVRLRCSCADREARPARCASERRQHAERDRRGQQQQCDDARAARQVPERLRVDGATAISAARLGRPAADAARPRRRTRRDARAAPRRRASRAPRRRARSRPSPRRSPRRTCAAATRDRPPAAAAGRPVGGSSEVMRLARGGAPAAHGRARRREAARTIDTTGPGAVERRRVVVGDSDRPPAGGASRQPRCRRPARRARRAGLLRRSSRAARSAAHAFAVAPRSSSTPRGTRSVSRSRVELDVRQLRAETRRCRERPRVAPRGRARTCGRSRPPAASAERRVDESVGRLRRAQRRRDELGEQRRDRDRRPARRLRAESSESARKRLHVRSRRSSCRRAVARASPSAGAVGDGDVGGRAERCERTTCVTVTNRPRRRRAARKTGSAPWPVRRCRGTAAPSGDCTTSGGAGARSTRALRRTPAATATCVFFGCVAAAASAANTPPSATRRPPRRRSTRRSRARAASRAPMPPQRTGSILGLIPPRSQTQMRRR